MPAILTPGSAAYAVLCCAVLYCAAFASSLSAHESPGVPPAVQLFLETHCVRCHGHDKPHGDVNFLALTGDEAAARKGYKTWGRAAELIAAGEMPPEDEPQPSDVQRGLFARWFGATFENVVARPANFQARRLSAVEYRRTLESLFGFPLTTAVAQAEQTRLETSLVMKLLPVDPKGPSGYTNDTSGNPLSTVLWEKYAYFADVAILKLFSDEGRPALEAVVGPIANGGLDPRQAQLLLQSFLARARRRDASEAELAVHWKAVSGKEGGTLRKAVERELKAIVMAPEFLYRGLLTTPTPGRTAPVDGFELGERLSYFLWADMPDQELFAAARSGSLASSAGLKAQVDRMLESPKARSLAEVFAVEWLLLDEIDNTHREVPYAAALKGQPIEFIHDLIVRDLPLLELIDSRTEFVNPYLVRYYRGEEDQFVGLAGRDGVELAAYPMQRIELRATPGRGGLLTMPGILTMNPTAIQRGTWMLERILGDHLGEPPPNVPPIKPAKSGQKLSFRERFTAHRDDKTCAVCHDRIDPLGFAFEAYNERGAFLPALDAQEQQVARPQRGGRRKTTVKEGKTPNIDASGVLPSGESFRDLNDLKVILANQRRRPVVENIVRQMLTYALCRELELTDEPVVDQLTDEMTQPGATWRGLIHAVTRSLPFQQAAFSNPDSAASEASSTEASSTEAASTEAK